MKKTFRKKLLFCTAATILFINYASSVDAHNPQIAAADTKSEVHINLSGRTADTSNGTGMISDTFMPRINAFTIASENSINMPEAGEYVNMIVADVTDYVNVRSAPDTASDIAGRIYDSAVAKIIKFSPVDDTWLEIESGEVTGYVKAEYFLLGESAANTIEEKVQNGETLTYARTMDDILAEIAAWEEARKAAEAQKATEVRKATEAEASDLRQSIVDFAMQYLGGPYVHGGNSLTEGTDCSGFTSLIFAEFGYSLSRTPSGQLSSNGTKIEYSEILPGDIICYTSNGKSCTHVALYIGDGQIIHAANSKKGIITNEADYSTIMGVKRIIE